MIIKCKESELIQNLIDKGFVKIDARPSTIARTVIFDSERLDTRFSDKVSLDASRIAKKFASNINKAYSFINPSEKDILRWANDIDKINRIDGYTWKEIDFVVDWVNNTPFWRQNIRSGATLRKQFVRLKIEIQEFKTKFMSKHHEAESKQRQAMNQYVRTTNIPECVIDERTGKRGNQILSISDIIKSKKGLQS